MTDFFLGDNLAWLSVSLNLLSSESIYVEISSFNQ